MAMVMHPDIQNKAQCEIDEVIGLERFPEISDRPNVHYVNALIKETMRWHPALPLSLVIFTLFLHLTILNGFIGIARRSQTDDIYEGKANNEFNSLAWFYRSLGYFIPAGTIVIPNVW
jgi:Cytochrome P450